jgi:hypothetical protein
MIESTELQELLCEQWCSEIDIGQDSVGIRLSLPLADADGDAVTVWIAQTVGGWTLRDCGTTLMRLSYDLDVDLLETGQRAKVLERILSEHQIELKEGELTCLAEERSLGEALLRFGQAAIRICDIKLWTQARVASTFYDDLQSSLTEIVGAGRLIVDYAVPGIPDSDNYLVDYAVKGGERPLYIFGVPTSDKAKLANIVLLHLQQANHNFDSLVVPSDFESISKPDFRRLMNVANDVVDSSASVDAIARKIRQRIPDLTGARSLS